MSDHIVEHDGTAYTVSFGAVRQSLSESEPMLWGFPADISGPEGRLGRKTCFVSRVSVQVRNEEALQGGMDGLAPALYELALEKIKERIEAGEPGDEITFA